MKLIKQQLCILIFIQISASFIHSENIPNEKLSRNVEKHVNVLILGAGAAGIAAARTLHNTNVSYLVLEANHKLGGRIRKEQLVNTNPNDPNITLNVGAEYLLGRDNPLFNYVKERDLIVADKEPDNYFSGFIRDDGYKIDETIFKEIANLFDEISDSFIKYINETEYPTNFESYFTTEMEKVVNSMPSEQQKLTRQIFDFFIRALYVDETAPDLKQVSAKGWGKRLITGGQLEHIALRVSLIELIEMMANDIGLDNFIFNKNVTKIHWNISNPSKNENKVLVECDDGTLYSADHVIVTFSLGILKQYHENMFVPPLQRQHKVYIECQGFGTISRIFLQFDEKWWKDVEAIQLIYTDLSYENANWTRYITGFKQASTGPPNSLHAWISGAGVQKMYELTESEIIQQTIDVLTKFTNKTILYPRRYFISSWYNDPYTLGSHTYPHVKCDELHLNPTDLAVPLTRMKKPILLFAGEGASSIYSTAHGAYMSGEQQATVILNYMNYDE